MNASLNLLETLEKSFAQYVSTRCGSHNAKRLAELRKNDLVVDNAIRNALFCEYAYHLDQSSCKARVAEINAMDALEALLRDADLDDETNFRIRSAMTFATSELAARR